MADTKVSALAALAVEMADTDEIYVNDGGVSKKQAYSVLKAAFATAAQGATAGTALQNIVEDTTPQLGGNLDVQARTITTSTVDGGITLTPNGTGNVTLGTLVLNGDATIGAGQDNYVLTYDHAAATWGPEAGGAGVGDFKADGTVDMTGEFRTDVGTFDSDVANGAAAVAFSYDTAVAYSTAGAKLANWKNNGTEAAYINKDGDLYLQTSGAELNIQSTAGRYATLYRQSSYVILKPTGANSGTLIAGSDSAAEANAVLIDSVGLHLGSNLKCLDLDGGMTVANLPTPGVGMIARVTDANTPAMGSTVAGGAAAAALVWYNGTNWTVIGV